jgi:hypothetical protein
MKLKPFIERVCREVGPRPAGSESESQAGKIIAEELRRRGAAVRFHETRVSPGLVPGLINLMIGSYLLSAALYLFLPVAAAAIAGVLLIALLAMRKLGNWVIDWLFPKTSTRNVIGVFKPRGRARKLLIFSGHHDSAALMPLLSQPYKRHVHRIERAVLAGMGLLVIAGILRAVFAGPLPPYYRFLGPWDIPFFMALLGFVPGFLYRFKMITGGWSRGANDNLSAVSVLLGLADALKRKPLRQTEVWLVSFGSEEPLIYGSAGFARDHGIILRRAVHCNLDGVGAGSLAVISEEKMTACRYSPEVVELFQRAGRRAGIELPAVAVTYGGTDSYPVIHAGGRSACLFAMDETRLPALWHSPEDRPENVEEEKLQQALRICREIIREFERA